MRSSVRYTPYGTVARPTAFRYAAFGRWVPDLRFGSSGVSVSSMVASVVVGRLAFQRLLWLLGSLLRAGKAACLLSMVEAWSVGDVRAGH